MTETAPWVTFLEHDVIGKYCKPEGMVYEVSIKIQPTGLFVMVKVMGPFGKKIAFFNAKTFQQAAGLVRSALAGESVNWREDKFAGT